MFALELKPCPFCGKVAHLRDDVCHSTAFFVGCETLGCFGNALWDETKEEAVSNWNTRAALSADPAPVSNGPDWEGFGRALMENWPTGDVEGSDLFDLSRKYRLIVEVPGGYDPEEHIDAGSIYPEKGDPWFEYNFRGERQ